MNHKRFKVFEKLLVSLGVKLISIENVSDDEFWELQNRDFTETLGLGKCVSETADQVGIGAYNSDDRRTQFIISKEMLILLGIAICKIVLWCLYRSAREDGLDVTSL